ncbi:MAG: hypothetical protein KAU01_07295 [Candidatus Cloacimonetes bacterium]|nr:hypothetical protein [Candidatus Cloacimonadota bacterium]
MKSRLKKILQLIIRELKFLTNNKEKNSDISNDTISDVIFKKKDIFESSEDNESKGKIIL